MFRDLRNRGMLEDTPIDAASLKKAIAQPPRRRRRHGGRRLADRGTEDGAVPFFGEPSLLPNGYIRLALSADPLLLVMSARWTPNQGYSVISCPPIELLRTGDREADIEINAAASCRGRELDRETPEQWLMYHPVWP